MKIIGGKAVKVCRYKVTGLAACSTKIKTKRPGRGNLLGPYSGFYAAR